MLIRIQYNLRINKFQQVYLPTASDFAESHHGNRKMKMPKASDDSH